MKPDQLTTDPVALEPLISIILTDLTIPPCPPSDRIPTAYMTGCIYSKIIT